MAPNPTVMPAAKLKGLKRSPTIAVRYRSHKNAEPIMLAEAFPRDLIVTFSSLAQGTFPPLNQLSLQDISKPRASSITIEGGVLEVHREVLRWMLGCCDGSGFRQYPVITIKPYSHYMNALESAEKFQIRVLAQELWCRMELIANKQVHSEDIREIYSSNVAKDHIVKTMAVKSIGKAILDRKLMARGAYELVRTEFPEFNTDIGNYIDEFKAQRYQARKVEIQDEKAEQAAIQKQKWADHIRTAYASKANGKTDKKYSSKAKNTQNAEKENGAEEHGLKSTNLRSRLDQDGTLTITDSAVVVRKAARGRPNYVKANLDLLGLKNDNFRPKRPGLRRRPYPVTASD